MTGLIDKLVVYPENMARNLDRLGGLIHSQRVLIALTQKGVAREDAYAIVQRHAMGVWQDLNTGGPDFLARLKADPEVTKALKPAELEALFDLEYPPQARRHHLRPRLRGRNRHAHAGGHARDFVMPRADWRGSPPARR